MAFDSLAAFWAMGKHGPYVWFCYALPRWCCWGCCGRPAPNGGVFSITDCP